MENQILQGNCIEVLKTLPENSIDLVCTDPPYGIGFMGKEWDTFKPDFIDSGLSKSGRKKKDLNPERQSEDHGGASPAMEAARYDHSIQGSRRFREWFTEVSVEMLRVLKPGGFAFVCIGARQDSVSAAITAMTDAGFKTDFTSIYWAYANGFPKAMNISKMVDKRLGATREVVEEIIGAKPGDHGGSGEYHHGEHRDVTIPQTDEAKALDGSYGGFQPKPAVEVIVVAMKPLSEKNYIDQALNNRKGLTWLDEARIPSDDEESIGRFPANLIVSDDALNDGHERKSQHNPKPAAALDGNTWGGTIQTNRGPRGYDDSGSFSRYFDLDKWAKKTFPFLVVGKASKSEKNKGLDDNDSKRSDYRPNDDASQNTLRTRLHNSRLKQNHHPTVKPIKLMAYLVTLGSRPGDIVLDPFMGSGTTCLAAKELGRKYLGIERELDYIDIANKRLDTIGDRLL